MALEIVIKITPTISFCVFFVFRPYPEWPAYSPMLSVVLPALTPMTTPFAFAKVVATLRDMYSHQGPRLFSLIYKQLMTEFKTFSNGILPLHMLRKRLPLSMN